MPVITEITDLRDPVLAPFARMTENQLRSRQHPDAGIFIAESTPVITLALDAGYKALSLLVQRRQIAGQARKLLERCGDIPIYTADDEVMASLTGFAPSRGVMAVMKRPRLPAPEEILAGASRVAVLENITDASNVGALIRSAAALGMDAVLVTPSCSDPLLRRAARVSMGTVFLIPWTYIGADASDWPGAGMALLHALGFKTAAMALHADTVSVEDIRLRQADKLAILLGTEGTGLMEETIRLSDYTVKIPMEHGVDSLNVAAASAIAFWEMRRRK